MAAQALNSIEIDSVSGGFYTPGQYAGWNELGNTAGLLGWAGAYGFGASVAFWGGWNVGTYIYRNYW